MLNSTEPRNQWAGTSVYHVSSLKGDKALNLSACGLGSSLWLFTYQHFPLFFNTAGTNGKKNITIMDYRGVWTRSCLWLIRFVWSDDSWCDATFVPNLYFILFITYFPKKKHTFNERTFKTLILLMYQIRLRNHYSSSMYYMIIHKVSEHSVVIW